MESCAIGAVGVMDILQGIVIGVFSGLTLGGLALLRDYRVRLDQIKYFRELIIKERKVIYSATDLSDPIPIPRDAIRATVYQGMRRDLFAALEGRASQLSFDEKSSIAKHLGLPDWILTQEKDGERKIPPFKVYKMMFSEWEKQAWLNLPAYEGEIPTE